MSRAATIATAWLLPPLLFWVEVAATPWPVSLDGRIFVYAGGLGATITTLIGALFALLASSGSRFTQSHASRRSVGIGLFAFLPITSYLVASEGKILLPALGTFLAVLISGFVFLLPLFGALLFWRPNARLVSRSFAGVVVACALPFVAIATLDFSVRSSLEAYQPPYDNWSPLICSRANVDEPSPLCADR